jgi:hypothetical protein
MANVEKCKDGSRTNTKAPVITVAISDSVISDSVMREARETLRASQIDFLLSSFHALKLSFSPADSKRQKLNSPLQPSSWIDLSLVGFSSKGNSIFEVIEHYRSCHDTRQDCSDFADTLCGIGFAFEGGQVIMQTSVKLWADSERGGHSDRKIFVSDKKYGHYTPQILEGETAAALTTDWRDIQFFPAKDSSLKPFTIKDLSNEERASLQVMVGGVADLWRALGVQILSRKEEQARAEKIDKEARLAGEKAEARAEELKLSIEQIEALRTASAEKRGKTR